jgi:hypothetical protein
MRLQTDDAAKSGSAVQHTGRFLVALLHPLDTAGMRGQDNLTIVGRAVRGGFCRFSAIVWTCPKRSDCQVTHHRHHSFQPGWSHENRPSRPFV